MPNADTPFPFDVELGYISFFCHEVTSRALCLAPQQISTQHPHLTGNEKAQKERFVVPENGGFPCAIDGLRVLATDAGLSPLILRVLGTEPVVSKRLAFLEIKTTVKDHEIRCHLATTHAAGSTRLWLQFVLVPK